MNLLYVCVMTIPPPLHQMVSIKGNVLLSSRLAVIHCDNTTSVITATVYTATVSVIGYISSNCLCDWLHIKQLSPADKLQ